MPGPSEPQRTWEELRWVIAGCGVIFLLLGGVFQWQPAVKIGVTAVVAVVLIQVLIWINKHQRSP
jgi:hypothetical protein